LTLPASASHTIETDAEINNDDRNGFLSTITTTRDDVRQFRSAVAGVLGSTGAEALPAPDPGWRSGWPALVGLGVVALCVPEDRDGSGLEVEVATAVAMELGAVLHGSPYAGLVASAHALAGAGPGDARATEVFDGVLAGRIICAYGRIDPGTDIARAVDGAPDADALLLEDPTDGDLVLLTGPDAWSLRSASHGFDVSRTCADVAVDPERSHHIPASSTARDLFELLQVADALGGVERALDRTVAYAKDRIAFGRPIGGLQAVQHRLADHAVRVRGMSLLVRAAAVAVSDRAPAARRTVLLAELSVTEASDHLLHDLLQLTGAIGFTWEYGLHFYQRRAHQAARLTANPRRARQALAELEGWTGGR